MRFKTKLRESRRNGLTGAASAVFLGLVFLMTDLGSGLRNWSFDYAYYFQPESEIDGVRLVLMDDPSHTKLEQMPDIWHRALHAELIQTLARQGAKAVVFDVLIDRPWTNVLISPAAQNILVNQFGYLTNDLFGAGVDRILSNAIQQVQIGCPVVVGGERVVSTDASGVELFVDRTPFESSFGTNVAWGVVHFYEESDKIIRQHHRPDSKYPDSGLAWKTASLLGIPLEDEGRTRWIRYYGGRGTIPATSYVRVFEEEGITPGYFSNQVVFVGMEGVTSGSGSRSKDEWPTPYTHWKRTDTTGVEIHATVYLNLVRKDWLKQFSPWLEFFGAIASGSLLGFGLVLVRPWVAVRLAILVALVAVVGGILVVWTTGYWFSWTILAGVQVPVTLVWSLVANTKKLAQEKAVLEESLATARSAGITPVHAGLADDSSDLPTRVVPPAANEVAIPIRRVVGAPPRPGEPVAPPIPDHTMLKCVGKGAYGEVWLAQDIIGSFHAVKVVYRRNFSHDGPFVREFKGVQKFTPISRQHPGLVHILHVGRNESAGYFYCIMEAGDDETTGQDIDPATYSARNLARELGRRGSYSAKECIRLGINLSEALEFLHNKGLIHRDIKPSNIIFVNGAPKFADIGLVTDIASTGQDVSMLGTEGFIAPEGPGTPGADVYSLGKLLYETCMGRDRQKFPELPTNLDLRPDEDQLLRLNNIILKACESDPTDRYTTATELLRDLSILDEEVVS